MPEHPPHILESGGTEVATAAGGARRYRKPLMKFRWRDVRDILEDSFEEWSKHNAPRLGAALSFYTLLSMAPLLLAPVSIAGMIMGREAAVAGVIRQVDVLGGREAARVAIALLSSPPSAAHGILATVFGLITLLFGASGVLVELRDALNFIWDVHPPELSGMKRAWSFVKDWLFSFALVLAVGFLLVVSLAVSAWIAALGALSAHYLPANEALLHAANLILSFVVIAALFAAIYKFLPDARIEWHDVALGGAVTSVLFSLGKLGLGIYLGKAAFASAYGAAASVVVLIVWVYYSAQIFFLGAEFTHVFANRHGSRPSEHPKGMVVASERETPTTAPKILTPAEAAQEKAAPQN
jgi:membrane protein